MENLVNDDFDWSSSVESDNESDSEPDNESDNDESNDWFANESKNQNFFNNNKSLIVYVNPALLGFYLCQSYLLQHW